MQSKVEVCPKLIALSLLWVLQLGFWIAFTRIVRLAPVVGEVASGPALELWILAPLIVLVPVTMKVWSWLECRGLQPSLAAKFSLGYLGLAASCTCLAASIEWPFAVGLGLGALTLAVLSLGPACVGAIWELAAPGQRGAAVVCWVSSYVFARALGGWMHEPSLSRDAGFDACLALGFGTVATAVLSAFMWNGLQTLASTDGPTGATAHSLGAGSLGSKSVGSPSLGSLGSGSLGSGSLG